MEIKYEMHLGNLHTLREFNGIKDLVVSIEYTYSGSTTIDGFSYAHGITRSATVLQHAQDVNADGVIDFNDITHETALEWVNNTLSELDILNMQGIITANIKNQCMYRVRTAPWVKVYEQPEVIHEPTIQPDKE